MESSAQRSQLKAHSYGVRRRNENRIRVARRISGLTAELTLPVLAAAAQDVIDGLRPAHDDDWMGMAWQIQQMVPVRVDDYVAAVMTGGVLVPLPDRADEHRH